MVAVSASMVKELRERTGLGMMECKKALVSADGDIEKAIEDLRKSSGMKAAKKAGRVSADGVVCARVEGGKGMLIEVNSETDFVARDENFLAFVKQVTDAAFASGSSDIALVMKGELEATREALVQKIGENISVRRIARFEAPVIAGYVHGNNRIATLIGLQGGSEALAKDIAMHVAAVNPQYVSRDDVSDEVIAKEREIYTAQAEQSGKPAEIIARMVDGRINKFLAESSLLEQAFVKDPEQKVGDLVKQAGAQVVKMIRYEVGEGIDKEEVDFAAEVAAQLKS